MPEKHYEIPEHNHAKELENCSCTTIYFMRKAVAKLSNSQKERIKKSLKIDGYYPKKEENKMLNAITQQNAKEEQVVYYEVPAKKAAITARRCSQLQLPWATAKEVLEALEEAKARAYASAPVGATLRSRTDWSAATEVSLEQLLATKYSIDFEAEAVDFPAPASIEKYIEYAAQILSIRIASHREVSGVMTVWVTNPITLGQDFPEEQLLALEALLNRKAEEYDSGEKVRLVTNLKDFRGGVHSPKAVFYQAEYSTTPAERRKRLKSIVSTLELGV